MINNLTFWLILGGSLTVTSLAQKRDDPAVLSICEALQDIDHYRGKDVVVIGRSGSTFEGTFMHERCDVDNRILLQGHRWLSMIALDYDETANTMGKPLVNRAALREKLSTLLNLHDMKDQGGTGTSATVGQVRAAMSNKWVAVYGKLESPPRLKPHVPPGETSSRNISGNGYGANGSVPARILVLYSTRVQDKFQGCLTPLD